MVSKARNVARKDIMMAPCRGYLIVARCQMSLLSSFVKLKSMIVCLFDATVIIISY